MAKAKSKTKAKPPAIAASAPMKVERTLSQPKAALRSEAFERALADAQSHANDPERLRVLFEEAARKAAAVPKEPFVDSWPYLQAMLRLVRAYFRGEYRNVPQDGLLWIITALNYFVDPFDLIPGRSAVPRFRRRRNSDVFRRESDSRHLGRFHDLGD